MQVGQTPFADATPTQTVPTPGPTPAPTNTTGNDPRLKGGLALTLLRTKMNSELNGWAIGTVDGDKREHILFTSDGGLSWKDRTPTQILTDSSSIALKSAAAFASDNSAWAIFSDQSQQPNAEPLVVWHTIDNGETWQPGSPLDMSTVNMEFEIPSDLGFLDEQNGWIMIHVGAGMMHDYFAAFTTGDGGQTWKRFIDPSTLTPIMSCEKSGLSFTSSTTGWITGNCPGLMPQLFIFHTADGGANWASVTLPVPDGKPAGYFGQSSIACGIPAQNYTASRTLLLTLDCQNMNNNTAQAWLYASSDDGGTWSQHPLPLPYSNLSMLGPTEGFLVGALTTDPAANGAVYHSADSGSTWSMLTSTAWTGLPDFVDDHTGWVIATHNGQTAFVHTLDGGRTWSEIKPVTGE
jgi:photosystem II stability/assembly factor-like uncharacterized protein